MGFSVSGATVIVLIGLLIGLGTAYTAASTGFDLVSGAQDERAERLLDVKNTGIVVANATFEDSTEGNGGTLTVEVENTGTTTLSVDLIDLLADGVYQNRTTLVTTVDGDGETTIWTAGETLVVSAELDTRPDRVKVVVDGGVSDATAVTEES